MSPILKTEGGTPENQDRGVILICGLKSVLCVADGAGGRSGGAEASDKAVRLIAECAAALVGPDACSTALARLDEAIEQDRDAGETTCVIAVIEENNVFGASVGDSGAWVIQPAGIIDLTRKQTRKPFVGSGMAHPISFVHSIRPGDHLILATDGLLKYTSASQIAEVCRSDDVEGIPDGLIDLVRTRSGVLPDDVTVISLCL